MFQRESRTYKSFLNGAVSLSYYIVSFALSSVARRVFLDRLGAEVMGLYTTTGSFLSYLSLAELGIGVAIGYTLYKPLQEKDYDAVSEIITLQGWFYKRVAWFIIAASAVLLFFFPAIFSKTGLPVWYPFACYLALLFSSLLGYFVNYRQFVLGANQQGYILQTGVGIITLVKIVIQLLLVSYTPYKFELWILMEVVAALVISVVINCQVKKHFPHLKKVEMDGRQLSRKHGVVLKKTRQLFIHKIGAVALNNTPPLIIYAYATLTVVTSYANYQVITNGVSSVVNSVFSGMNAGVGNLIAEGDKTRIWGVFRELFTSRFLIISTACYCMYNLSSAFIALWVGGQYVLDGISVLFIVLLFYILTSRVVVESYINAYGLFGDVWAPFAEAIINVGSSVAMGRIWGLPGILGGMLLSQVLIVLLWKPYMLFRKGLKRPVREYALLYAKHLVLFGVSVLPVSWLMGCLPLDPARNYLSFFLTGVVMEGCLLLVLGLLLYVFEPGMREFSARLLSIFSKR